MAVADRLDLLDPAHVEPNRRGELAPAQRRFVGVLTGVTGVVLVIRASAGVAAIGIGLVVALVALAAGAPVVTYAVTAVFVAAGAGLLWTSLLPILQANQMRQDLNDGRVEQAQGEVVWRAERYVAQAGRRYLKYEAARGNLEPGSYTFYYLPRSGWVVGAEPAAPDPSRQVLAEVAGTAHDEPRHESAAFDLRSALARANGFSQAALETNRSGRLGEGQGGRLIRTAVQTLFGGVVFAAFGVLIGLLLGARSDSPVPWIVGAALVLAGLFLVYQAARLIADATGGRVEMTEGVGQRSKLQGRRSVSYYYHVDKLSFAVSRAAYDALLEDRVYRFYYTPRTRTLVAVEPV